MNVKLHTPKTLKSGSGMSSLKQFLLSLVATTVSIVLTFGTAAVIDHHKKQSAKKEMVMMVISDFDKTIEQMMAADTAFYEAARLQLELASHPEMFDSLRIQFMPAFSVMGMNFSETTEKIFSSSIETFHTIGNADFVHEVSTFYITRNEYQETVLGQFKEETMGKQSFVSIENMLSISFPEYAYLNWSIMQMLKKQREKCMLMMHVTDEEMRSFTKQRIAGEQTDPDAEAENQKRIDEWQETTDKIQQALKRLKK